VKNGWQTKKLGDLVEVQNGYAFNSKDYSQSGHFLMRIGNVQNGYISTSDPKFIKLPSDGSLKRFVLYEGDILVSLTGNVGRVGVMREEHLPAALNQRVARISIRKDSPATRELILLFLYSDWFREELSEAGHGAAQQNVSTKDLVEIEIHVPPLDEQKRIVAKLDEAFAGLATAKANAEKNLQNARALFESHLDSVFTQRGSGWVETRLDEACEIIMGQSPDGESYNTTGEGVPLINGPVEFSRDSFGKTVRSKFTTQPTKFCKKDDLILCVRGSTTGRMNIAGFDACVGRGVAAIRSREYQPWINHFINAKREEIYRLGTGATFPNVSGAILGALKLSIPALSAQREIVAMLESLRKETQRLARLYVQKLEALESLKKSILHEAFSGNL